MKFAILALLGLVSAEETFTACDNKRYKEIWYKGPNCTGEQDEELNKTWADYYAKYNWNACICISDTDDYIGYTCSDKRQMTTHFHGGDCKTKEGEGGDP